MADKTYLAVDLGAESGRVMAGRFDGSTVSLEQFHRFPNTPVNLGGTLRWNLPGLWSEIQKGLQEARSQLEWFCRFRWGRYLGRRFRINES